MSFVVPVSPALALIDDADAPEDAWTLYAGVVAYDAATGITTARLYRDGRLVDEAEALGAHAAPAASRDLVVGDRTSDDHYEPFRGRLDDVRVFDRALTAGEVDALYREGGFAP